MCSCGVARLAFWVGDGVARSAGDVPFWGGLPLHLFSWPLKNSPLFSALNSRSLFRALSTPARLIPHPICSGLPNFRPASGAAFIMPLSGFGNGFAPCSLRANRTCILRNGAARRITPKSTAPVRLLGLPLWPWLDRGSGANPAQVRGGSVFCIFTHHD